MLGRYLVAKQESLPAETRPEKRWITAWHLPWGHLQPGNTHSASVNRFWRGSCNVWATDMGSAVSQDDNNCTHLLQLTLEQIDRLLHSISLLANMDSSTTLVCKV